MPATKYGRIGVRKIAHPRWLAWLAFLLIFSRIHLLANRLYDPDEFEHAHVSYSIVNGLVPYRDFFEHHTPLPYYLAAPIVWSLGGGAADPWLVLSGNRLLSFCFLLITATATWHTAARLYDRRTAWWTLFALLTLPLFAEKSVEWRPDALALALLVTAAFLVARRSGAGVSGTGDVFVGLLVALAALCTQKVVFLGCGVLLAALFCEWAKGPPRSFRRRITLLGLGFCLPWAGFLAYFAANDSLLSFCRCAFYFPLTWPRHDDPGAHPARLLLGGTGFSAGHLVAIGLAGLCGSSRLFRRRRGGDRRRLVRRILAAAAILHLLAAFVMPAAYLQYYLLAAPLILMPTVAVLRRAFRKHPRAWLALGVMLALVLTLLVRGPAMRFELGRVADLSGDDLRDPINRRAENVPVQLESPADFANLVQNKLGKPNLLFSRALRHPYSVIDFIAVCFAISALATIFLFPRLGRNLVLLALLISSVGRIAVQHLYWPGRNQLFIVRTVNQLTRVDQPVVDGFSGYGFLRPHAYYWWWINEHSLPLMEREGAVPGLLAVIAARKPGLIIVDGELERIIDNYRPLVEANYEADLATWRTLAAEVGQVPFLLVPRTP